MINNTIFASLLMTSFGLICSSRCPTVDPDFGLDSLVLTNDASFFFYRRNASSCYSPIPIALSVHSLSAALRVVAKRYKIGLL